MALFISISFRVEVFLFLPPQLKILDLFLYFKTDIENNQKVTKHIENRTLLAIACFLKIAPQMKELRICNNYL